MTETVDAAHRYALDVVEGRITACQAIRGICQRHLDDLDTEKGSADYAYDLPAADRIIRFAETFVLQHGRFDGQTFRPLPWQQFVLRSIYGWKHSAEPHPRRIRRVYLETAKGSGKLFLSTVMGLHAIFADREPGAQAFVLAETWEQAGVIFLAMAQAFEGHPDLHGRGVVVGGVANPRTIRSLAGNKTIKRVSANTKSKAGSGPMASFIAADEFHEMSDGKMLALYEDSTKHRTQPLTVITTNSGVGIESPCYAEHVYALNVAKGAEADPAYLPLVYAVDEKDKPFEDEACWIKANPSLPTIPGLDYLRAQVSKAQGNAGAESAGDAARLRALAGRGGVVARAGAVAERVRRAAGPRRPPGGSAGLPEPGPVEAPGPDRRLHHLGHGRPLRGPGDRVDAGGWPVGAGGSRQAAVPGMG